MAGIRLYKGYSKKNFRVGVVKPKPIPEENPVVVIRPTWISAGLLSEYAIDYDIDFIKNENNTPRYD